MNGQNGPSYAIDTKLEDMRGGGNGRQPTLHGQVVLALLCCLGVFAMCSGRGVLVLGWKQEALMEGSFGYLPRSNRRQSRGKTMAAVHGGHGWWWVDSAIWMLLYYVCLKGWMIDERTVRTRTTKSIHKSRNSLTT
jgi:SNF family Na+-dependent transporter